MDPSQVKIPPIKNLSAETITENTILINSGNPDPRFKYVLERLVSHLHDFARETRLSTKEWMGGLEFLTATGKACTDVRQVCHDSTSIYSQLYRPNRLRNSYSFRMYLVSLS